MTFLSDMKKTGLVGEGYVNPADAFIDGNLLFLVMGRWGYTSAQESFFNKGLMDENKIVELPLFSLRIAFRTDGQIIIAVSRKIVFTAGTFVVINGSGISIFSVVLSSGIVLQQGAYGRE